MVNGEEWDENTEEDKLDGHELLNVKEKAV